MTFAPETLSVAVVLAVSNTTQFMVFFAIIFILWILALTRQTLVLNLLSSLGWFSFMFAIYIVSDGTELMTGLALFSVLMGIIMTILSINSAFEYLRSQTEERRRRVEEEIM